MKKRRNLIVALLLVATMVVGIGYATLSQTLTIEGTTNLNAGNVLDVQFTDAEVTDAETFQTITLAEAAEANFTGTTAGTYRIKGLKYKGDTVTMVFTVTNKSDAVAYLTAVDHNLGSLTGGGEVTTYFDHQVTIVDPVDSTRNVSWTDETIPNADAVRAKGLVLQPGASTTVTIVIELLQTVGANNGTGNPVPETIEVTGALITLTFKDENS